MSTKVSHPLKHRLITCFQSTGRVGKSTAMECILSWCSYAGISVAANDSDAEHRTFSKRFPQVAFFDATQSKSSFLQLLQGLPDEPVILADFPAQATDFLLGGMEQFRALDILEAQNTRVTVLLFAADDQTAQASLAKTIRTLGDRADYILIKNSARFDSVQFDKTVVAESLKRQLTPVLDLPPITSITLSAIENVNRVAKRYLSLVESAKDERIPLGSRFEIEYFLNRVFTQCEDAAALLLPDVSLVKNKVMRTNETMRVAVDEFDPLGSL